MARPRKVFAPAILAEQLQLAYRAMITQWREVLEAELLSQWNRNPVAFGPGGRVDSSAWTKKVLRGVGAKMADAPTRVIADVAAKVDARATRDFVKLLAEAKPKSGRNNATGEVFVKRQLQRLEFRPALGGKIDTFRRRNVDRIRSLKGERLDRMQGLLDEAEAGGWSVDTLRRVIEEDLKLDRNKAELLARDQTLKLAGDISRERQTSAGIREYRWSTSGDERVRGTPGGTWPRGMHYDLNDTIQSWDDPPETNENGDRNHPGGDIQCRCIAIPVLPDIDTLPDVSEDGSDYVRGLPRGRR